MPTSSEDLFVALTNYADSQHRLLEAMSRAQISSTETSMYLNNTYYSDLSYSQVPQWLINGGFDDSENDVVSGSAVVSGSLKTDANSSDEEGLVCFPALVKMRFKEGCEGEDSAGSWELVINEPCADVSNKVSVSAKASPIPAPSGKKDTEASASTGSSEKGEARLPLSARRKEDRMRKSDPRCWFSSMPPRMLTETQRQWRSALRSAIDLMRTHEAAVAELAKFETENSTL